MEKVKKIYHNGSEILVVDYSESNADKMMGVFDEAKALVRAENKPVLILSLFNNKNYINAKFIKHIEKELPEFESMIEMNAAVGLTEIQKWILKGINLWYKRQIRHFDSIEEALDFLAPLNQSRE